MRDESPDDLLLAAPEPHRFARAFLLEQQVGFDVAAFLVVRKMRQPFQNLVERVDRVRKLTEAARPIGRSPAVVDGFAPRLCT